MAANLWESSDIHMNHEWELSSQGCHNGPGLNKQGPLFFPEHRGKKVTPQSQ